LWSVPQVGGKQVAPRALMLCALAESEQRVAFVDAASFRPAEIAIF
jgi:hypothetical protein